MKLQEPLCLTIVANTTQQHASPTLESEKPLKIRGAKNILRSAPPETLQDQ